MYIFSLGVFDADNILRQQGVGPRAGGQGYVGGGYPASTHYRLLLCSLLGRENFGQVGEVGARAGEA